MTYAELIEIIREDFLDDVADTPDLPDEDYRWPTDFLVNSLNEAERQVCRRKQDMLYDETTAAIVNPTIVADQRYMALDSRVIDIVWMTIGSSHDRDVIKTTRERLDESDPGWRRNVTTGYPDKFFIAGQNVYWNMLPSATCAAEQCNLGVWRWPLGEKDLEDTPEVAGARDLIHWVLFECFGKPDEDTRETFDEKRARKHLELFNAAFGRPMSNAVLAGKAEAPRNFSASGPNYFGRMNRRGG